VSDVTTLQVKSGDVTDINIITREVTNLFAAPATITLEKILMMSNVQPFDIARTSSAGVLELASRADHVHSAAGLLLDGGNY
jgi:hypothetical protein